MQVVLISRGSTQGGRALAKCLEEHLPSFRCVCREDLVKTLDAQGDYAKKVLESIHGATRAYDQFSQLRHPYLVLMRLALLRFIRAGDLIYHGNAGHLLVADLHWCLRLRVDAPMAMRTRNAMERLNLPEAEAHEAVLLEDEERVRWARFMYGKDIRDPRLYDACFSLDRLTSSKICAVIVEALMGRDMDASPEQLRELDNLYLSAQVEAALAVDESLRTREVRARACQGKVVLEGPFLFDDDLARTLEIARSVEGVLEVDYQPGYATSFESWQ